MYMLKTGSFGSKESTQDRSMYVHEFCFFMTKKKIGSFSKTAELVMEDIYIKSKSKILRQ